MIENFEQICGVSPQGNENLDFQASDPNFDNLQYPNHHLHSVHIQSRN